MADREPCPAGTSLDQTLAVTTAVARTSLAMAGAATRNILHGANVVLVLQRIAQCDLVGVRRAVDRDLVVFAGLLVLHVEYLVARPQELLGSAMAVQAPLHTQRVGLQHQRHLVYL